MLPEKASMFKCSSCQNTLLASPGVTSMTCPYCKNTVEVPVEMRKPASIGGNPDAVRAVWGEVVQLAQSGNREEAIKKYMAASGLNRMAASSIVDSAAKASPQEMSNPETAQDIYSTGARAKLMGGVMLSAWKPIMYGCGVLFFAAILATIFGAISYYLSSIF
jgi:LSD1 subclass zinc finger protein